jgi:hypothetical protein
MGALGYVSAQFSNTPPFLLSSSPRFRLSSTRRLLPRRQRDKSSHSSRIVGHPEVEPKLRGLIPNTRAAITPAAGAGAFCNIGAKPACRRVDRCGAPSPAQWTRSPHIGSNRPEARQGPCPTGPSNALVDCFRIVRDPGFEHTAKGWQQQVRFERRFIQSNRYTSASLNEC